MAILAMPEHGQDARGTKSMHAVRNLGNSSAEENRGTLRATGCLGGRASVRADRQAGSPPDLGRVGAVSDGGGYDIHEGSAACRRAWLQDPNPQPLISSQCLSGEGAGSHSQRISDWAFLALTFPIRSVCPAGQSSYLQRKAHGKALTVATGSLISLAMFPCIFNSQRPRILRRRAIPESTARGDGEGGNGFWKV